MAYSELACGGTVTLTAVDATHMFVTAYRSDTPDATTPTVWGPLRKA